MKTYLFLFFVWIATSLSTVSNAQTATPNNQMVLVVPAYKYPVSNSSYWNRLDNAASKIGSRLVVIANVNSGPGEGTNSDYVRVINSLKAKGATVLGYRSLHGVTPTDMSVETDVEKWYNTYGVDGIFYDEADYTEINLDIRYLYWLPQLVKNGNTTDESQMDWQTTVINMGRIREDFNDAWTATPRQIPGHQHWQPHKSLLCPFENYSSVFSSVQAQLNQQQHKDRCVIMLHSLTNQGNDTWNNYYNWLRSNGFKYIYITDDQYRTSSESAGPDGDKSPYSTLPTFFEAMVEQIR